MQQSTGLPGLCDRATVARCACTSARESCTATTTTTASRGDDAGGPLPSQAVPSATAPTSRADSLSPEGPRRRPLDRGSSPASRSSTAPAPCPSVSEALPGRLDQAAADTQRLAPERRDHRGAALLPGITPRGLRRLSVRAPHSSAAQMSSSVPVLLSIVHVPPLSTLKSTRPM
jgi:hypothetical protein